IGTNRVLNMDVPTFALLGAGTWIMCRQVIFRISNQIAHHRFLINFPTVSPLMQGLTQGILYLLIYTVSLVVLIAAGRSVDMTSLPDHPLMVGAYGIGMWFFAVSLGFIFGGIAIFWPYFLRFATVLERAIQLFSSVAFVSEQLPEEYRGWLTWSPTSHGLQLMRSFYFDSYPSVDASASYFWTAILFLTCGAFLFERLVRPYMQPI
ncbi:MAG TPA: sugar ABC transporter permease, partial [Patescibacteria group bacterium]|nr:sugar ABC transporter permease [Patescibacteria group bacterium]